MRSLGIAAFGLLVVCVGADPAWAQNIGTPQGLWKVSEAGIAPDRGPGWYLSLWQFVVPLLVFFAWVSAVDWLSQDCQRLKLGWQKWNPLVVGVFLVCFLLHYLMPMGILGILLVLLGTLPVFVYVKKRNKATTVDDRVLTRDHIQGWLAEKLRPLGIKIKAPEKAAELPIEIAAQGGANAGEDKAVTLKLPQIPGCDSLKKLLLDALEKRAGAVILDYSQQTVALKYQIDGVFHDAPNKDRNTGDALLIVLKTATFLNPAERVKRQSGRCEVKFNKVKYSLRITSQGTQTGGERVLLNFDDGAPHKAKLDTIGMRQKTQDDLKAALTGKAGMVIVAAPPGRGLTTLLSATASGIDRFMRSTVCVESTKTEEMKVENVVLHRFNPDKGETPATILPTVFRTYPDAYVMPDLVDAKTAELLCHEVTDENRLVVAAIGAKEAAEALLRVLMLKVPPKAFVPVVSAVVCGRLVRKLCPDCKQAYAPPPQLLQQLRLPADRVPQLFRHFQPPPLEPGKKPAPPCATCKGIGYHGRTGIFELLIVNDAVRAALAKTPTLEAVRQAAQKAGMHTMQEEAIALLVQGVTSLEEISRALKE